jgi:hypothetical protein
MSRTILYYPNIQPKASGPWIRKALLYWDNVAAIVPRSYDDHMDEQAVARFSPELEELRQEKVFKPLNPGHFFADGGSGTKLSDELLPILKAHARNWPRGRARPVCDCAVYRDKTSEYIFSALRRLRLADKDPRHPLLYFFEKGTAAIYMALLAKHMAAVQDDTVPATDDNGSSQLTFGKTTRGNGNLVFSAAFKDLIPVPSTKTPLRKILKFRDKYRAELLGFREELRTFERAVAAAPDREAVTSLVDDFKDRIERESLNVGKALRGSGCETATGSLEAFLKAGASTITTAGLATATGKAIAGLPPEWVLATAVGGGAIAVGMHWFNRMRTKEKELRSSPFAYVFLAKKKFAA